MQALLVAQPRDVGFREPDRQVGRLIVVAAAEDLAAPINPRQSLAVGQRNVQPDGADFAFETAIDQRQKPLAAHSRNGRQGDALRITQHVVIEARPCDRIEQIDLIHHLDQPVFSGVVEPEIDQHAKHVPALRLTVGMINVADMDNDVGLGDLLKGRSEGGNEMSGQVRDEADRVRQNRSTP